MRASDKVKELMKIVASTKVQQQPAISIQLGTDTRKIRVSTINDLAKLVEQVNGRRLLIIHEFEHDRVRIIRRFEGRARILQTPCDYRDWDAGNISIGVVHASAMRKIKSALTNSTVLVLFGAYWDT